MTQEAIKQTVLNVSTATAELVTKILAQFPQAHVQPRPGPAFRRRCEFRGLVAREHDRNLPSSRLDL